MRQRLKVKLKLKDIQNRVDNFILELKIRYIILKIKFTATNKRYLCNTSLRVTFILHDTSQSVHRLRCKR